MVGRRSQQSGAPRTRANPERCRFIDVFPHGEMDVRSELEEVVQSLDKPHYLILTAGLQQYHNPHAGAGDETEFELLPYDYWDPHLIEPGKRPEGWYEGAEGSTRVWLECWQWAAPKGGGRISFQAGAAFGYIEASCLTWHFEEMDDYASSLVIETVQVGYGSELTSIHTELARKIEIAMSERFARYPARKKSKKRRKRRQAALEQAHEAEYEAQLQEAALAEASRRAQIAEAERTRQIHLEAWRQRRLVVVYDTSYLMDCRGFVHEALHGAAAHILNVTPLQVTQEIAGILEANDQRRAQAAAARGAVNDLRAAEHKLGDAARWSDLDISSLPPTERVAPLDADSVTDRLITSYAAHFVMQFPNTVVVVATRDGGIGFTIERLRREQNLQIFRVSDARNRQEIEAVRQRLNDIAASVLAHLEKTTPAPVVHPVVQLPSAHPSHDEAGEEVEMTTVYVPVNPRQED